jgi:small subunit ribosomal protein S21
MYAAQVDIRAKTFILKKVKISPKNVRLLIPMATKRASKANISISVNDNVERALRQLKKKIEREGVVRDMKRGVYFEPPTQKRRKKMMRAIKQNMLRIASAQQ